MKKYIFIVGMLIPYGLFSQTILGKVTNNKNENLIGASIYWLGTTVGASTDDKGEFIIESKNISDKKLIASFVGYTPDTVEITKQTFVNFKLKETKTLDEVIVKGQREGIIISNITPIKTEMITQTELRKAACCDLAGCFETQSSVQPQTTNVITNSKELRILGLSGVYNQVLVDGFPMIQGLSYTYGISGIPGTLVDNIYVSKGANSVLQGFESISGQINVETKEPDETDKLLLNVYMNDFLEKQINANYAFKKKKWSNLTSFHTVQPADKIDTDNDNFLDLPQLTRYMLFDKWKFGNDKDWGWSSRIGLRFLKEQRIGGQTSFNHENDKGNTAIYGQSVDMYQPEAWTKTAYRFNDNHRVTFHVSSFHQNQESFFGTVKYDAQQTNLYSNLQYELDYSKNNSLKTGISLRYMDLNEKIAFTDTNLHRTYDGNYEQIENIPGIFAENTLSLLKNKLTWITGIRGDQHNQFGFTLAPRTLIKYDVTPYAVFRANFGAGWRTVKLFSENIGILVSSRDIIITEQLTPEKAINYGINFTQKFEKKNFSGYFSADYYRTNFQNQIFPDYDSDPTKIIVKNFSGKSVGDGFQAELSLKIWSRFEIKTGYNYLDVYRKINGTKKIMPFNPKHKELTALSYMPLSNKFHFDLNIHWYGKQRLPDTKSNPIEFQRLDFSQPYKLINVQFTYNLQNLEIYAGCENVFDYRQEQPIISWQNPFSPYFDISSVWGPTRGREIYMGIRFKLASK